MTSLTVRFFLTIATVLSLAGCDQTEEPRRPDAIYLNGSIWTGVTDAGRAQAIAVADGRIVAVGMSGEISALTGVNTRVVDLAGAFVVPGFIDNHTHFMDGGKELATMNLRSAATPDLLAQQIGEFASNLPAGSWAEGGGWDHELWDGVLPRKDWVDAVTPDNPVFVVRYDGHMALANSLALALAGIDATTPNPDGGAIVRDENGEATGVLKDTAMGLVTSIMPPDSEAREDSLLARAMDNAVANGVTQIHDMGLWRHLQAYQRNHARGGLKLRIYSFVPLATWARLRDFVATNGRGDQWLRWGGLKGVVDGSLGSTTAWFYAPYDDEPDTSGLVLEDLGEFAGWINDADAAGLHLTVHAIGDAANDWLLDRFADAVAANGPRDRRFRIEHAQHLSAAAIPRFAGQGVIPSMQPYHAIDDGRWAEKRIGAERIKTTYAFGALLNARAALTFGSDWTVAPMSPLAGIYAAVTRRTLDGANPRGWVPDERISVGQALRAYTAANAYAGYQEADLGTLEAGKLADFVVLSADLFAIEPAAIKDVQVLRTVIGGNDAYLAE